MSTAMVTLSERLISTTLSRPSADLLYLEPFVSSIWVRVTPESTSPILMVSESDLAAPVTAGAADTRSMPTERSMDRHTKRPVSLTNNFFIINILSKEFIVIITQAAQSVKIVGINN